MGTYVARCVLSAQLVASQAALRSPAGFCFDVSVLMLFPRVIACIGARSISTSTARELRVRTAPLFAPSTTSSRIRAGPAPPSQVKLDGWGIEIRSLPPLGMDGKPLGAWYPAKLFSHLARCTRADACLPQGPFRPTRRPSHSSARWAALRSEAAKHRRMTAERSRQQRRRARRPPRRRPSRGPSAPTSPPFPTRYCSPRSAPFSRCALTLDAVRDATHLTPRLSPAVVL